MEVPGVGVEMLRLANMAHLGLAFSETLKNRSIIAITYT
jgi:hypothetical protein